MNPLQYSKIKAQGTRDKAQEIGELSFELATGNRQLKKTVQFVYSRLLSKSQ